MNKLYFGAFANNRRPELVKKCIEHIEAGLEAFYILPSREAMFDVRRLFIMHAGGLYGCHVFGFDDLERKILGQSLNKARMIGEPEQRMLLGHVLDELPAGTLFDKVKDKPGFSELLAHAIRQFKRLDITPGEFKTKTQTLKENILKKCEGLYAIYDAYEKLKAEKKLLDADDISMKAPDFCLNAKAFKNAGIIVIDGFFNIDPVNLRLVKSINEHYPNPPVYVNVPFRNINNEEFLLKEIIEDFKRMGFEIIADDNELDCPSQPSLKAVAQNIFSSVGGIVADDQSLRIQNSPCMDHEIRVAAGKAKQLIQDLGLQPSKIAFIVADMANYRQKILSIFEEYKIPANIRQRKKLASIPLIKDAMSLWRLGIKSEYVIAFRAIVTSKYMLPIEVLSDEGFETDRLHGIAEKICKSKKENTLFEMFQSEYDKETQNQSAQQAMKSYIKAVCEFESVLNEYPSDAVGLFKEFIRTIQISNNILKLHQNNILNDPLLLRDIQALSELEKLFERFEELSYKNGLGLVGGSTNAFIKSIFSMTDLAETGSTSKEPGGVRFITPDLVRGQVYDAVFVLGLNEGIFPAAGSSAKLFDASEIKALNKIGIAPRDPEWELEREKLRFNACLASARTMLYLSFRTADEDGSIMITSPFLDELNGVLDQDSKKKITEKPVSMRDRVSFASTAFSIGEMVKKINTAARNDGIDEKTKISAIIQDRLKYPVHAASVEFSREFNTVFDEYDGRLNNPVLVQQDAQYAFSPSQLNNYLWCPFVYFAQRVLGVDTEDEQRQELFDIGNFYHAVMAKYHLNNQDPFTPNLARLDAIFNIASSNLNLDSIVPRLKELVLEEHHRILKNLIIDDAANIKRYGSITGYAIKPTMLEVPFELKIGQTDNLLKGRADRIDLEINAKGDFTGRFIIYDYKKGSIKGIKECIERNDLQLALYYFAFKSQIGERLKLEKPECLALIYYSIEKLARNGIIRKDIKSALFEGQKGTKSTPAKANMEVVLSWAQNEAIKVIKNVKSGYFMLRKECPASGIYRCPYSGLCRYDSARIAQKESVAL